MRYGITMGEYKAKPIKTNLGTLKHDQTYPGIIQAYSGIFRTLCYPDIFYNCGISRTQNHIQNQKLIQNPGIFRTAIFKTLAYSKFEEYSEPCLLHIYDDALIIFTTIIIFTNYNYFAKLNASK